MVMKSGMWLCSMTNRQAILAGVLGGDSGESDDQNDSAAAISSGSSSGGCGGVSCSGGSGSGDDIAMLRDGRLEMQVAVMMALIKAQSSLAPSSSYPVPPLSSPNNGASPLPLLVGDYTALGDLLAASAAKVTPLVCELIYHPRLLNFLRKEGWLTNTLSFSSIIQSSLLFPLL